MSDRDRVNGWLFVVAGMVMFIVSLTLGKPLEQLGLLAMTLVFADGLSD